jgi:hypothetical protein
MRSATIKRCSWSSVDDPLMLQYHDREFGIANNPLAIPPSVARHQLFADFRN